MTVYMGMAVIVDVCITSHEFEKLEMALHVP
jgi:hypothetical protein